MNYLICLRKPHVRTTQKKDRLCSTHACPINVLNLLWLVFDHEGNLHLPVTSLLYLLLTHLFGPRLKSRIWIHRFLLNRWYVLHQWRTPKKPSYWQSKIRCFFFFFSSQIMLLSFVSVHRLHDDWRMIIHAIFCILSVMLALLLQISSLLW